MSKDNEVPCSVRIDTTDVSSIWCTKTKQSYTPMEYIDKLGEDKKDLTSIIKDSIMFIQSLKLNGEQECIKDDVVKDLKERLEKVK